MRRRGASPGRPCGAASAPLWRSPEKEIALIVVTNRIPVAAGHEADFEDRFRRRAHLIDQSPGFIKNLVLRPVQRRFNHQTGAWEESKEQGYYLVQTYWESEQDFWNWTRSDSFRQAHSSRPPSDMFAGPSVLEIHDVIQNTEARSAA
jgi:heme oxygenase (mycobilin-producing)